MQHLRFLILFGAILFCCGLTLTVMTWPYALAVVEVDTTYAVASGIIFIIIFTGQLMSIIATSMFSRCIEGIERMILFWFLAVIFYVIIWFSCGAGQLIVVILMIINVDMNSDPGTKAYGAIIIAFTMIYMFASSVYSTVVFIWFYHKWNQTEQKDTNLD